MENLQQVKLKKLLEGRIKTKRVSQLSDMQTEASERSHSTRPPVLSGMEAYTGEFGMDQARHLLKRTTFGPTLEMMREAVNNGPEWTLDQLLRDIDLPEPPVAFAEDPALNTPIGETWVDSPYSLENFGDQITHRRESLFAWQIGVALEESFSIREKMTLFWHNHYAVEIEIVEDPRFMYQYIHTLRENALGNFRELTKIMTLDPAMLRYLNGNDNQAQAPNENYARELLELFSIGKGPQVAEGDYTNYTEKDILEGARILTGWRDRGYFSGVYDQDELEMKAVFRPFFHDTGDKQLSHRFDNAIITNMGEDEYTHFIDLIYTKSECARFLARKIYRWFVYYDISEETEMNVIEPMAQCLIDNDYEVKPMLRLLLASEHFYDPLNCGCLIKNPIDFALGCLRELKMDIYSEDINTQYRIWLGIDQYIYFLLQMGYFSPPSVAGWPAYYQAPGYHRLWITSATIPTRMSFTDIITYSGFSIEDKEVIADYIDFIEDFENPTDPNDLIDEAIARLMPKDLSTNQKNFLKQALIFGLPDFEWTVEYSLFLNDPEDEAVRSSVESKLRNFFRTLFILPEYYLS